MSTILASLALIAAASAPSSAPAFSIGTEGGDILQIRADTVLVGDGTTLTDALILVQDGKITSIGKAADASKDLPLIEHKGVLSAGIVVGQTQSGAADEAYEESRSTHLNGHITYAFDPDHSDYAKALASGITSLVLAPSGENLVGGLTAVVKSYGGTVVAADAQLAISFAQVALSRGGSQFAFFFGDAEEGTQEDVDEEAEEETHEETHEETPTGDGHDHGDEFVPDHEEETTVQPFVADGSPESTTTSARGSRMPTSYSGSLSVLAELFGTPDQSGSQNGNLARAKAGTLPVLLEAWDRNEVARALTFAGEQGLKGALRGAPLAGDPDLLEMIKGSGFGVIAGPFEPGQRHRSLAGIAQLQAADVPLAFALDKAGNHPENVRLSAAMAVQAGADLDKTWSALTGGAATMAGVAERVGLVAVGRDADFVFWSGHPLDLTSSVESVWVDGAQVLSSNASK